MIRNISILLKQDNIIIRIKDDAIITDVLSELEEKLKD